MPLDPGTKLGPYTIVAPLGAGGMGAVFRARDERLGRDVAVKVLHAALAGAPEVRARFEREARTVSQLNHPHICTLFDVGHQDGTDYLVMELVEGETLARRLERGALPVAQLVRLGIQIADALDRAHRAGIVHRDLKPANVMLTKDGAKLMDFGLARGAGLAPGVSELTSSPTVSRPLTAEGTIVGTFQYMAPEQLEGREADARSDLWAFGATLYEMATGRRAFEGRSQASLIAAILEKEPPALSASLPGLDPADAPPPALELLIRACLAKDPEQRLQTAHDARLQLQWIAQGASGAFPAPAGAPAARGPAARERLAWGVAAAGVAAAGVLAALLVARTRAPGEVMRFVVPEPAAVTAVDGPVPSPDGRCLAFLGSDSAGVTRVWLRPLDAVTAAPIPGSEGAHRPFWSPDSRFVAFFANGQLRKAPVDGGPAQLVCEASGSDGAWGSKDVILFDGSGGDSIRAVPAGGGVPTGATRLDHAHDFADGWPCFLPDGRHFLYNAQGAGATSRLMVGELGSTRTRSLGPVQTRVLYAAPGYLVTMSADVLVARRFDTRRLAFAGDPIPIVDHVAHGGDFMEAGVSQTGRLVYIDSGRSERGALQWVDRTGRLLSAVGEPLAYRDFALSPDGRRLAYGVEDPQNGTQDLWIRDLARGVSSRFTFEPGNQLWPVWSPDGQRLAYASDASGTFDVVVRPVSGAADQETLVHRAGPSGPTDWSRDGTLLFTTYASGGGQIWTVAPQRGATPQPYVATPFSATAGRLSPDGRFVAYESTESGRSEIYVQPFPLANRKVQVSAAGGHDVWWRADGRELFYVDASSAVVAVPVTTQPEFVAGPPRTLFQRTFTGGGIPRNRLEPAGDGQRFLVNVPANTSGPSPLELIVGWPQLLRRR